MDVVKLSNSIPTLNTGSAAKRSELKIDQDSSFGDLLKNRINEVDAAQKDSDKMIHGLASGSNPDIHNTMIAIEKADISFQLMMQIRNKLVSAYQEIYRMQM